MSVHPRGAPRTRADILTPLRATTIGLAAVTFPFGPETVSAGPRPCADVALVLAIDTSGSVDAHEFDLQIRGLANAFLRPDVQAALSSAGIVAATAVFWGDPLRPSAALGWFGIAGPADAAAFSAELTRGATRIGGDTGLGEGIDAALDLLDEPGGCAGRRVVNLSGDGKPAYGRFGHSDAAVIAARARAEAAGVTINALAIRDVEPDLADYYRVEVATGPGAFVMEVAYHEDFAEAIARKIAREVAAPFLARAD